ncbi:MAG: DUF4399 domain-containing protein [Gemmatimonadota bacterium]
MKNVSLGALGFCVLLAACGGDSPGADSGMPSSGGDDMAMSDEPIGTVTITEPANSADVMGNTVTVQLTVDGFPIVEAGDMTPGTGHHHLFLDADVTSLTEPIPTVPGSIVHMGDGSSSYTFENVPAGEHRLIAVVADGAHVPLQPLVTDTVVFTVH